MIKLDNVGKTYLTKSKSKVKALKGVSFELGESGMTFVLGKSGSGKSTLLNLLGGLDRPTFGNISIDGVDMQSFTQSDYESYRNSYVGFVFQEYNLLDDFNVKDNVALALQLSKDVNVEQKVVEALKQVELDEQYLTRRVGELSGGEKQRVAIARAIVKDSKMILADEPTGNLDSETGESIWSILKNLSRTRPVIIVSHDRESAEKYANRIIEISDGKVIADNGSQQVNQLNKKVVYTPVKQKLSFAMCLKMGFNNLIKHKIRAISVILVSLFTVCAFIIAQIVTVYLPERSVAKHIKKTGVQFATVAQGYEENFGDLYTSRKIYQSGSRYKNLYTKRYIEQNAQTLEWGIVDSKQQLLDFGFEFIGEALELDEESFYLSQSAWELILEDGQAYYYNTVIINGQEKSLYNIILPLEQIIGRQVRVRGNGGKFYKLAGIVKSVNIDLPEVFAMEKFPGRNNGVTINSSPEIKEIVLKSNGMETDEFVSMLQSDAANYVITKEGIVDGRNQTLNEGEVIISWLLNQELFAGKTIEIYVDKQGYNYNLQNIPSVIGETVKFDFYDYATGELVVATKELKVVGVEFSSLDITYDHNEKMFLHTNDLAVLYRALNDNGIIVKIDTVKNLSNFLVNLRTRHMGYVQDVGSIYDLDDFRANLASEIYGIEGIHDYCVITLSIGAALLLIMMLLVINLISFSINSRKKEIGILSALGASAGDIIKIFVLETHILACAILALSFAGTFSLVAIFNAFFSKANHLPLTLTFFVVDPYSILTLLGVCFVVLPLFALLPTIRIAKLKPIDAIRVL